MSVTKWQPVKSIYLKYFILILVRDITLLKINEPGRFFLMKSGSSRIQYMNGIEASY